MTILLLAALSCVPADSLRNGPDVGSALPTAGTAMRIEDLHTLPRQSRGLQVSVEGRFARLLLRRVQPDGSPEALYFYVADAAANALLVRSSCEAPDSDSNYRFVGRMDVTADGQPYLIEEARFRSDAPPVVVAGASSSGLETRPSALIIGVVGGVLIVLAGGSWSYRRRVRQTPAAPDQVLGSVESSTADAGTVRLGSNKMSRRDDDIAETTTPFRAGRP
jgi:hypothetical protein